MRRHPTAATPRYRRRIRIEEWIERYGRAWESGDAEAAAALFTAAGVYRSHVFRDPTVGTDAIRAYWQRATSTQDDVRVRFGRPVVDANRVAVEWWTTMVEEGDEVTLPGCLVLRFADDGRCEELREYWHLERGRQEPPAGWGE